jgi:RND family efflux transporter MFP subunit
LEQDKIDVARATPVTVRVRRGAPLWLQLLLSLIVVAAAAIVAGFYNGQANQMLAQVGLSLPLLNAPVEAQAQPAGQQAQGQRQGGGQGQGQQQAASQQGARQGQGGAGGRPGGGGRSAAVVIAETVVDGTINDRLTAVGEGSAIHSVTVTSASGGTLLSVAVKPGDRVEAGAELATLDAATLQNGYDRAKLASADADTALARAQSLANSNSIPATQLDAARLAADNARLALEAAQIALDQRTIRTPIGGTIGLIQVSPGNLINAQSIVTTVEDSSEILVNFWVPERYAGQIATGMPVKAGSVALPGATFEGTVSAVDNRIDPASRTLQVQATLPNADGTIRPGMSFSVSMSFAGQTFPAVDPLAIQWSNEGAYVWKIVDGKVQKGMVEIVQRNSDGVLVSGDVVPGDQVVTQGVLQLSDGAAVRLLDEGQG